MHSSRMRTARSLAASPSMLCWGGAWSQGVPAPGGVPGPRDACSERRWCLVLGGCLLLGGCLVPGGGGGGIPACTEADPPLWTEFLTHASENITLLQTSFTGGKKRWLFYFAPCCQRILVSPTDSNIYFGNKNPRLMSIKAQITM